MIDEDEGEISDFIAEDYSDEGDPVSGVVILEWRVTDAGRVERAFRSGARWTWPTSATAISSWR
jgi:hypothetical protein